MSTVKFHANIPVVYREELGKFCNDLGFVTASLDLLVITVLDFTLDTSVPNRENFAFKNIGRVISAFDVYINFKKES